MKGHERLWTLLSVVLVLLAACNGGSSGEVAEPEPTPNIPEVGETATAAPTATEPPEPPTSEPAESVEPAASAGLDDQAKIDAALAVFELEDLPQNSVEPGEVLDLGLISSEIQGGVVMLRACPWFDWGVSQIQFEGFYRVSDGPEPVVTQEALRQLDSCTNAAMLQSAAEFVVEYLRFEEVWFGPDGDPRDPEASEWYDPSRLGDLVEAGIAVQEAGRSLRYQPVDGGIATAWAPVRGIFDVVIAVRAPHDDRYGWYTIETGERLKQFSNLRVPAEFQGDDYVSLTALRWGGDKWGVFTFQDLSGVKCSEPDCVELLNTFGTPEGRGINRTVPFHELQYLPLPEPVPVR